jgi:hypothetical protein
MPLSTLKTTTLAPMPKASVRMTGLFDAGDVAEVAFGSELRVFATHTASQERFDFFGEVLPDLLREIAVDLPAMQE